MRRARPSDQQVLCGVDVVADGGDAERRASIGRWCESGAAVVAEGEDGLLGYCVVEYTFFGQGFVAMLMVAPSARRRGVGRRLLDAAASSCTTEKLFTSTNVSNRPMQGLLERAGWLPVGLLHGLDAGDPELFYLCPRRGRGPEWTVPGGFGRTIRGAHAYKCGYLSIAVRCPAVNMARSM
ncbi:GNAT family N-acetyltransferase [Streptomyces roseolus]|uniref:GNAT family N-acetyltransferase n=1 Tax=Streptomyces roseolus TaxID=67358 RepID=UPI0033EBDB0D